MIKSLKKALLLIPAYILILLSGCVIGVLLYMLYYNTTGLVAGKPLQLFNIHALYAGFFVIAPIVIMLSGGILSCYRIRHSKGGFLPVLMFILLGAAAWGVVYPSFIQFKSRFATAVTPEKTALTPGYFRRAGSTVVYVPVSPLAVHAVVINEAAAPDAALSLQKISVVEPVLDASPFKDILIRDTIPVMPGWILQGFADIEMRAEQAWNSGYVSWLCFASFGLALFSSYALTFCSQWRLVDVIYLCVMQSGILSFNLLYYSGYARPVRAYAEQVLSRIKFVPPLDEPLLVCVNVFSSLVFICVGAAAALTQMKTNRRRSI
jgi:hypothetical protein